MQALYLTEFGSSAVLQYGEVFSPSLQSNEVLVKNDYIGFNFVDAYRRRRTYQIQEHHPYIDGYEGTGQIVQFGNEVNSWLVGQKVLYVDVPLANAECGGRAEHRGHYFTSRYFAKIGSYNWVARLNS